MLLQSLLCSESQEDRCFAVRVILQEREQQAGSETGENLTIRTRRKVHLNREATGLRELIHWEWEGKKFAIAEPILTRDMPADEVRSFEERRMEVPKYPVHGQAGKRAVKEVTAVATAVYGAERRDRWVRARLAHRVVTGGKIK